MTAEDEPLSMANNSGGNLELKNTKNQMGLGIVADNG